MERRSGQAFSIARGALFGAALLLSACATPGHGPGTPQAAVVGADGIQRIEVVGGAFYFEPSRVTVKVGVPVELTLRKVPDILPHDFILSAPEAGIAVAESLSMDPKVVRFTPTRTGTYPFYCSKKPPLFPSHRERGMEGMLEVLP